MVICDKSKDNNFYKFSLFFLIYFDAINQLSTYIHTYIYCGKAK